ncbi:hypothetical protein Syun_025969 [Stephania yunnanensis]|uniref:Uncharacterized protein n=1 Tax=Stephania yunnanensis TaxID=152371 RepID=A0AAP0HVT7_9MAGN
MENSMAHNLFWVEGVSCGYEVYREIVEGRRRWPFVATKQANVEDRVDTQACWEVQFMSDGADAAEDAVWAVET